jgi:hypothetical protein
MRRAAGLKRENGGCNLNISYLWHQLQPASMWRLISSESMKASINGYQWRIGVMASAVSMAKAAMAIMAININEMKESAGGSSVSKERLAAWRKKILCQATAKSGL